MTPKLSVRPRGKADNVSVHRIEKKNNDQIRKIEQVHVSNANFISVSQDMKEFLGKYDLHHDTVGKCAKGMIKKAFLKANREPRAVKIIDKL